MKKMHLIKSNINKNNNNNSLLKFRNNWNL